MISTTYVFLFVFIICPPSHTFSIFLTVHSSLCLFFPSLCPITHGLLIRSCRSQSADSGSTYMMNWVGTPAAQVPPHVHGDIMRGELLCGAVLYDTVWLCIHTWNSLCHLKWANSPTAASNMTSQCLIHYIRTLQGKYWSFSEEVSALKQMWRLELTTVGEFANHSFLFPAVVAHT